MRTHSTLLYTLYDPGAFNYLEEIAHNAIRLPAIITAATRAPPSFLPTRHYSSIAPYATSRPTTASANSWPRSGALTTTALAVAIDSFIACASCRCSCSCKQSI